MTKYQVLTETERARTRLRDAAVAYADSGREIGAGQALDAAATAYAAWLSVLKRVDPRSAP